MSLAPGLGLRWLAGLASAVALLLLARPAGAQHRHRVVLLEPEGGQGNTEIHARLRGELAAAGFELVSRPVDTGADLKITAEAVAGELHPAAVLYVVEPVAGADPTAPSEVWISDRLLRRTFVMRYRTDPATPSTDVAKIAVQAVEILKADLAELSVMSQRREPAEPPPPRPVPVPTVRPREPTPARTELHAGFALLQGFTGVSPTWTPFVRAGASLPERWLGGAPLTLSVLAGLTAFGGEVRFVAPEGEAGLRQALGELELVLRLAPRELLQPFFALSGGAYAASVRGIRGESLRARQTWSGATGAGVGVWLEASPSFALVVSGELSWAWSRTVVRIAEERVASAGSPLALGGVGAVGVF